MPFQSRRKTAPAWFLGAALLSGIAGWSHLRPEPLSLDLPVEESQRSLGFTLVPVHHPESAARMLERRLEALAKNVEARRATRGLARFVEFDVIGLNAAIEEVLTTLDGIAAVSVHVRDVASRQVIFDYHGDTPLVPASTQKLVTSSAALDLLGPDYTFSTRVFRSDDTLFIVGEGDPMLDTDALYSIAVATHDKVDFSEITRIVVDDTAFSPERLGPGYSRDGIGVVYEAPSGALSLNFNTVEIAVAPQRGSTRLQVETTPACNCFEFENAGRRGSRRALRVETFEREGQTVIGVAGTLTKKSRPVVVRRRVADPGRYAGGVFSAQLAELASREPVPVELGQVPESAELLVEHESPPLIEVLDSGLSYSNNFIAEQVLRTLAWRMSGEPGDWSIGKRVLEDYWLALGNDPEALVVENAAGLSRDGRLTTAGLVDLIAMAHRDAAEGRTLIDALPVAGEAGTLRSRLRRSGKRVRAKTGTLNGVSGLSGVVTSEDGQPQLAFGILINVEHGDALSSRKRRRVEDRIVMLLLAALDDYEASRSGLVATR